jgi:hypothetical protein
VKPNFSSLFGGLALILAGGFALANEMGYLRSLTAQTWALVFAAASALFFVTYFVNGIRAWGWLFPACVFAGLSATIMLFRVPAAQDWLPTLVVGSIAVPFIAAYALDRSRTWALIPAFILGFIAFIPPLDHLLKGNGMGVFIVGMLGLPFIAASVISPKAWWGIIPGGILVSLALMILLGNTLPNGMSVAIMFLGWMLTFGLVWIRQSKPWAKISAIVMGALACLMFLISIGLKTYWALGLIATGIALIALSLRPHPETSVE